MERAVFVFVPLAVLALPDDDVLDVVAAAFKVRRRFFGRDGRDRKPLGYLEAASTAEDRGQHEDAGDRGREERPADWRQAVETQLQLGQALAGGDRRLDRSLVADHRLRR